ncbi:wee1-like protein kinase [Malus domestica]|uniref:wee1-like protein kinase n=1 Tax=Malus domestica TaxID=3750 RepID=UPI0004992BEE
MSAHSRLCLTQLFCSLPSSAPLGTDVDPSFDDREFILSQDFFCTPDYITPDNQPMVNGWDCSKLEDIPCPRSPEKSNTVKSNTVKVAYSCSRYICHSLKPFAYAFYYFCILCRRKAMMEVQSLAALGSHENIVGYYSSWFENEQLHIQMELCDHSLSINKFSRPFKDGEILEALYQVAKALQFIHRRGIAHLDVKPDNIYVKNGVYKLGDFGCATLLDNSLPIEEGDARYMPQEILNEKYGDLDKADIFSLGVAVYELIRGSPLPESGPQILNLREGKLPLLPGHSLQFQNLLKVMLDPNPVWRPSAKDLVENPIFDKVKRNGRA